MPFGDPTAKASWDSVLAHNAFDVAAMYELLCVIEQDGSASRA